MQYSAGTCSVTNGTQNVVGSGTQWLVNATVGGLFTVNGSGVTYTVASVTDDTHLTLNANYAGVTAIGVGYAICNDFTPNFGIPLISAGDIQTATILKAALSKIDSLLYQAGMDEGEVSVASAGTVDLGAQTSHIVSITGTTGITSFGSSAVMASPLYRVIFAGALTLTYNATTMQLLGNANVTTAAGDNCTMMYLGSGNWAMLSYTRKATAP